VSITKGVYEMEELSILAVGIIWAWCAYCLFVKKCLGE